ncbi:hypothetical protein HKD37_20G055841 [Glycine soja]
MAAEWRRKRERRRHFKEKMSLEEAHHHRRPWIRAWRKKEMNEGRGREEHEILCSKRVLKSEVNIQMIKVKKKCTHMTSIYSLSVTKIRGKFEFQFKFHLNLKLNLWS